MFGLAAALPAQVHIHGRIGPHVQVQATFGDGPRRIGPAVVRPAGMPLRGGHWEPVVEQVWVPGCWVEEYVPPRYGWIRDACGRARWGIVEPGYTRRVQLPGRYENRTRRVWVRGC